MILSFVALYRWLPWNRLNRANTICDDAQIRKIMLAYLLVRKCFQRNCRRRSLVMLAQANVGLPACTLSCFFPPLSTIENVNWVSFLSVNRSIGYHQVVSTCKGLHSHASSSFDLDDEPTSLPRPDVSQMIPFKPKFTSVPGDHPVPGMRERECPLYCSTKRVMGPWGFPEKMMQPARHEYQELPTTSRKGGYYSSDRVLFCAVHWMFP